MTAKTMKGIYYPALLIILSAQLVSLTRGSVSSDSNVASFPTGSSSRLPTHAEHPKKLLPVPSQLCQGWRAMGHGALIPSCQPLGRDGGPRSQLPLLPCISLASLAVPSASCAVVLLPDDTPHSQPQAPFCAPPSMNIAKKCML